MYFTIASFLSIRYSESVYKGGIMRKNKLKWLCSILVVLFVFLPGGTGIQASSQPWPTHVWKMSTPEEQGIDSTKLARIIDDILASKHRVHSLLVIRNGYMVMDCHFYPFTTNGIHDLASVTKAITGAIAGIAVDKGYIKGVDQPVLEFFPDLTVANLDERKRSLRVEHLLSMRDGIQCVASPTEETLGQMISSSHWVQFMLDLPMEAEPGTRFLYNSGAVHLLSAIITQATGQSTLEFGRKHLFGPLGIADIIWPIDPQGNNNWGWGDLKMRPHDLAKIGYLYLNNGIWDGKRILSEDWISRSTQKYSDFGEGSGYGYQWTVYKDGSYSKSGRGGQFLHILPQKNMVIVIHGAAVPGGTAGISHKLALTANETGEALPPNPEATNVLLNKIKQASQKPSIAPKVSPLPEIASKISGKVYHLEPNMLGVTFLSIAFSDETEAVMTFDTPSIFSDQNLEYKVGLDGISRISPGRYGLPSAATGRWASDYSFVVSIDGIGDNMDLEITLNFTEEAITGTISGSTFPGIPIRGKSV
jgi:CubicO group peptidase (beta-lactamase class C family)